MAKHKNKIFILLSLTLVVAIGMADSLTGPELSLWALYLIPISVASYYIGLKAGIWTSLLSILVYLIADSILSISYSQSATPYWNSLVRFLFFVAVVFALCHHRKAQINLSKSREQFRIYAQLHEIDRSILSALSSEEIASETMSQLKTLVAFDIASIAIFDLNAGSGKILSIHPYTSDQNGSDFFMDESEVMQLANSGSLILTSDDVFAQNALISDCMPYKDVRSILCIPLLTGRKLIGAMTLGRKDAVRFTQQDIDLSKEVANQTTLALNSSILFEEITSAHQRLQLLSQQLLTLQESEKHHLARELHDEMGQSLTALRIHLDEVHSRVQSNEIRGRLVESIALVEKILEQARSLSLDLRPLILDDLGLQAALRWYVSRKAKIAGFSVHFEASLSSKLPSELETACFRIAQEAITNTIRHANATKVQVALHERNSNIELLIKDDGVGFDLFSAKEKSARGKGFGLLGIRERVNLLRGEFEIESFPHCGTQINIRLPLSNPPEASV